MPAPDRQAAGEAVIPMQDRQWPPLRPHSLDEGRDAIAAQVAGGDGYQNRPEADVSCAEKGFGLSYDPT